MALTGQFLDVMVIIMLAVVGALVMWLHYRLYTLKNADKEAPSLVNSLSDSLQKANRGVFELSRLVRENGPELEKEIFKAQQTVQDLDFMLDKAERILKRMDESFETADKFTTPVIAAAKAEEKSVLTGQSTKVVEAEPKVERKVSKPNPRPVAKPAVSEAAKKLEAEMQKNLERELLMGMNSLEADVESIEDNVEQLQAQPKRMASPRGGAMAYGQQMANTSDAERDLRQALEGRL